MSPPLPPTVQLNTLVQPTGKPYLDFLTKVIVIAELAVGLNRSALFGQEKRMFNAALVYTIILNCILVYCFSLSSDNIYVSFFRIGSLLEYSFCTIVAVATCKRLQLYYIELNKFDKEYGCHPKTSSCVSLRKLLTFIVICFIVVAMILVPSAVKEDSVTRMALIPIHLIRVTELFYYGHLLNLLSIRLRKVNLSMKSSLNTVVDIVVVCVSDKSNIDLKKQMRLYHIITNAYNELNDAIKWQFLEMIIMSFIFILTLSFQVSINILRGYQSSFSLVTGGGLAALELVSLFLPCTYGDQVHSEVKRLREVLANKLYDNKLGKQSRSTARALLALTENRNLSFSLLRVLNIDISFPFKFMELVVAYVIIFLQFEKVINA